jgi:hypothetical protein
MAVLDDGEVSLGKVAKPRFKLDGISRFPRNWDSTTNQVSRAMSPWEETILARSSTRESRIQD